RRTASAARAPGRAAPAGASHHHRRPIGLHSDGPGPNFPLRTAMLGRPGSARRSPGHRPAGRSCPHAQPDRHFSGRYRRRRRKWISSVIDYASPRRIRAAEIARMTAAYAHSTPNPAHGWSIVGSGWTVVTAWPALAGRNLVTSAARLSGRKPAASGRPYRKANSAPIAPAAVLIRAPL